MGQKRDYYEILGVQKDANDKALKKAYRELALRFHPDKNKEPSAADRFKEISEAYAVLSDAEKRQRYDRFGHAGIDQQYTQEDIFRSAHFEDVFGDLGLGDIFGRIFGGGFGFGGPPRDPRAGRTIEHPYAIDLEDAFHGATAEVELRRLEACPKCSGSGSTDGRRATCRTCGGHGQVSQVARTPFGVMQRVGTCPACRGEGEQVSSPCRECKGEGRAAAERTLEVKIPAGVEDGMRLRLAGEGEAGLRGGPAGDLILRVQVRPSARFERDGDDLYARLGVSFPRAALGGKIPFQTLDGGIDVDLPAGVQSGKRLRIQGKGMPRMRGGGHGDLYLVVQPVTPERLSPRARDLMTELAAELGDEAPGGKKKKFVDRVVDALKND